MKSMKDGSRGGMYGENAYEILSQSDVATPSDARSMGDMVV